MSCVQASSRRTNSLGRAKADCHTCSTRRIPCDRQRPQCGPCREEPQPCGGYVLNFIWKDTSLSEVLSKNGSNTVPCATQSVSSDTPPGSKRQFRFKKGRSRKKRKSSRSGDAEVDVPAGYDEQDIFHPRTQTNHGATRRDIRPPVVNEDAELLSFAESLDFSPLPEIDRQYQSDMAHNLPSPALQMDRLAGYTPNAFVEDYLDPYHAPLLLSPRSSNGMKMSQNFSPSTSPNDIINLSVSNVSYHDADASEDRCQVFHVASPSLFPGILYNNLSHKFGPVLAMYDQEFCIMPLTADCSANPFRVRKEHCEGSRFLLHAILALSMQHLAKKDHDEKLAEQMLLHRSTAIHLYSQALSTSRSLSLLDTLLIMINLDATQSASGTWDVHLMGAYKLLESAGGVEVCRLSSRIRAQVAMLVWWDVTIALISRQEPLFPLSHLEILLGCDENDGWTFFALNGCPGEFLLAMARLAKLASIYEKVASLQWTTFNLFPVKVIVQELEEWKNNDDSSYHDIDEFENADAKRNRFHCTEAWRHAIILYTLQVFTQKQDQRGLKSISYLARIILDHIRCIKSDEIIQKQVLIPIFLAAAETGDETDRDFIRKYCKHWSSKSRYFMFETAQTIIERIWAGWHLQERDIYWWGLTLGVRSSSKHRQDNPMTTQILLG